MAEYARAANASVVVAPKNAQRERGALAGVRGYASPCARNICQLPAAHASGLDAVFVASRGAILSPKFNFLGMPRVWTQAENEAFKTEFFSCRLTLKFV